MPFPTQLSTVCILSSLVLCPTTRSFLLVATGQIAASLNPQRSSYALGVLSALLKCQLIGVEFYVSYYFIYVPLSSCH